MPRPCQTENRTLHACPGNNEPGNHHRTLCSQPVANLVHPPQKVPGQPCPTCLAQYANLQQYALQ